MRIWDYRLLPYLPDAQFKGQLRELVAIMHDWRDKGNTNHLLINKVMEHSRKELYYYFSIYETEYIRRYGKSLDKYETEFVHFCYHHKSSSMSSACYEGWHNKEYLRVCVCNLYEKYRFGVGKSKITQTEWDRILQGYKDITGEDWVL